MSPCSARPSALISTSGYRGQPEDSTNSNGCASPGATATSRPRVDPKAAVDEGVDDREGAVAGLANRPVGVVGRAAAAGRDRVAVDREEVGVEAVEQVAAEVGRLHPKRLGRGAERRSPRPACRTRSPERRVERVAAVDERVTGLLGRHCALAVLREQRATTAIIPATPTSSALTHLSRPMMRREPNRSLDSARHYGSARTERSPRALGRHRRRRLRRRRDRRSACARPASRSFTIFERGETVGGVWRANTYPGAACDVPSHLYSFSFAPGQRVVAALRAPGGDPRLPRARPPTGSAITPHIRFGTEVTGADFDPDDGRWTARDRRRRAALVRPPGHRVRAAHPPVDPGAARASTSSRARASTPPSGTTTSTSPAATSPSIGTGASAIQFVPEIAQVAGQTTIYQRSAPWILREVRPRLRATGSGGCSSGSRCASPPLAPACSRSSSCSPTGSPTRPRVLAADSQAWPTASGAKALGDDPELLAKATPDYEIGCKRVLVTDDWYPTLRRDDVELDRRRGRRG